MFGSDLAKSFFPILNVFSSTSLLDDQFDNDEDDFLIDPSDTSPLPSTMSRSMLQWAISLVVDVVDFLALESELKHPWKSPLPWAILVSFSGYSKGVYIVFGVLHEIWGTWCMFSPQMVRNGLVQ